MRDSTLQRIEKMTHDILRAASYEEDPDAAINLCIQQIGTALLAERCYIFELIGNAVFNTYEWTASGITPEKDNLQNIPPERLEGWLKYFRKGKNIVIPNIEEIREEDPWVYETLHAQNIHSVITGPLLDKDRVVGFYGIDNPPPGDLEGTSDLFDMLAYFVLSAMRHRNLERMSFTDELTGLGNRRALRKAMEASVGGSMGIVFCDVIGLKRTNDTRGHSAGDALLLSISQIMTDFFGRKNSFRLGGDEFVALYPGGSKNAFKQQVAELELKIQNEHLKLSVGDSWSSTGLSGDQNDPLIQQAEKQMYESKRRYYQEFRPSFTDERSDVRGTDDFSISDGKYTESIHFCTNRDNVITDDQQMQIDHLLMENSGVGIISGYYDEGYSVHYISDLALAALGYRYYHDFTRQTRKQMGQLFDSDAEQVLFEEMIHGGQIDGCIISMIGRAWTPIPMYVIGGASTDSQGKPLWIISIRKMTELHRIEQDDHDAILNSLGDTALFVMTEREHKILYFNHRVAEVTPNIEIGMLCKDLWDDACEKGPAGSIGERQTASMINYNTSFGETVKVTATRILWKGEIPAFLMQFTPCQPDTQVQDPDYDSLTGAYTRRGFTQKLDVLMRQNLDLRDYAVLFVNIHGFKAINGLYGSDAGDNLLRTVYTDISQSSLAPLLGGRKEADHFVFLVHRKNLDYRILTSLLSFKWKYPQNPMVINSRCGIYLPRNKTENIQEAISRSRLAMDYIRDSFIQPYAIFDSNMERDYVQRIEVLASYENALKDQEFQVYYQPVVRVSNGQVASAEALVRWISPEKGMILPNVFIPALEEYGHITKLDHYVIHTVKAFQLNQDKDGLPVLPISVNLSRMDLYDEWLLNEIKQKTKNSSLPADSIRYEITETAYSALEKNLTGFFTEMRALGKKIMLDDFGTGYSSFAMIQEFDFDILKIDIGFTRQLERSEKVRSIVETIITMCHNLGIEVVAEGVENAFQMQFLKDKGCDYVQGYLIAKPMDEESFRKYLQEHP